MTAGALALAWLFGLLCGATGNPVAILLAPILSASLLALWRRDRPVAAAAGAAAAAGLALLGAARWQSAHQAANHGPLGQFIEEGSLTITGRVKETPVRRGRSLRLLLDTHFITHEGESRVVRDTIQVQMPLGRTFHTGDIVQIEGRPALPPQYPDFDYRAYLARQGIHAQVSYPRDVTVVGHEPPPVPQRLLEAARARILAALDAALPHPTSDLAAGILTGDRSGIPRLVTDDFNRSGLSHLIAISGYNISIIGAVTIGAWSRLAGRRRAALIAALTVLVYGVFAGLSPSVARAVCMGLLTIWVLALGRPGTPLLTLLLAAVAMTAVTPLVVLDAGFQLSFAATAGILLLEQPLRRRGEEIIVRVAGRRRGIGAAAAVWHQLTVTLAATIAVLPVMLHTFGRVSLVGPLANLLVAPLFPVVMLTSALAAVVTAIVPVAAGAAGAIAWPPLAITIAAAHWFAGLPLAAVDVPRLSVTGMLAFAALIAGPLPFLLRVSPTRLPSELPVWRPNLLWPAALAPAFLLACSAIAGRIATAQPDGRLHVQFAEAGAVLVALVTGPSGERVLVNTGADGDISAQAVDSLLPPQDRRIDTVVLPRTGATFSAAAAALVERYGVSQVAAVSGLPGSVQSALRVEGLEYVTIGPGDIVMLSGGARLRVDRLPRSATDLVIVAEFGDQSVALGAGAAAGLEVRGAPTGTSGGVRLVAVSGNPAELALRDYPQPEVITDGEHLWLKPGPQAAPR